MFEAVSHLTEEEFGTDLGSSLRSIRETLTHIVWAEWIWLERWRGMSPRTIFQATAFPSLDDLRVRWLEVEVEQRAFLEALPAERLHSVVRYVNVQGQTWQYALWRQMYHVVNLCLANIASEQFI